MQKIKYAAITAIFFSVGLFASEDFDESRVWDVQIVGGDFIFYRVPGQAVWGHRYGFVKQSPTVHKTNSLLNGHLMRISNPMKESTFLSL